MIYHLQTIEVLTNRRISWGSGNIRMIIKQLYGQKTGKRRLNICTGFISYRWTILFSILLITMEGQAIQIFSPTGLGMSLAIPRQDAAQIGGSGIGWGFMLSLNYKEPSNIFINTGAGFFIIPDDILQMNQFQTTIFPSIEVQFGKYLSHHRVWHPNVYLGINIYAAFDKIKVLHRTEVSERFFQSSGFVGGGVEIQSNYMYSIHINADYRYVFFATEHSGRKYIVFWIGFLFYQ